MRNITGLIPYQNLAISAKLNGGPESYIKSVFSAGYCKGVSDTCKFIGGGTALVLTGIWIYKRVMAHTETKKVFEEEMVNEIEA